MGANGEYIQDYRLENKQTNKQTKKETNKLMAELLLLGLWVSCSSSELGLSQKPVNGTDIAAEGLHSAKNKMLSIKEYQVTP